MCKNIGYISDTNEIIKGKSEQGMCFKDYDAFKKHYGICYAPEISDVYYNYNDILKICKNNNQIAELVFDMIDWQFPESCYYDLIDNDEVYECSCGHAYHSYEIYICPYCGLDRREKKQNIEIIKNNMLYLCNLRKIHEQLSDSKEYILQNIKNNTDIKHWNKQLNDINSIKKNIKNILESDFAKTIESKFDSLEI